MRWSQSSFKFIIVVLCGASLICCRSAVVAGSRAAGVRAGVQTVRAGNRSYRCNVVTLDLTKMQPRVVVANGGVGRTEPFLRMIQRSHAVAAVNGSFFEAYTQSGDKDPDMTLIHNGQVVHKGSIGSVIGFGVDGAVMGQLDLHIRGTVSSLRRRETEWYAYWLNRTPHSDASITLFTPARGAKTRAAGGMSVIVENGIVVEVARGDAAIPANGFVIQFQSEEERQTRNFPPGARVEYHIERKSATDSAAWKTVREAVGAGPRLVTDGRITVDADKEGFVDQKILVSSGQRSAIGIDAKQNIFLVTVRGATVIELAHVMQLLGCRQAMNLDGGASSALYCNGQMITRPGRDLSNILAFIPRQQHCILQGNCLPHSFLRN